MCSACVRVSVRLCALLRAELRKAKDKGEESAKSPAQLWLCNLAEVERHDSLRGTGAGARV
eukprot:1197314-Pleurochrysis_carterae.AAC.1